MSMLPFFEWCESTAVGASIRGSLWLFPVIESFHLLALALIGGAILVVDLRLLGLGLRSLPARQLGRDVEPWLIGGLAVMITIRDNAVPVGVRQVLLQFCLLDKDERSFTGACLHLHHPPKSCERRSHKRGAHFGQDRCCCISRALVYRRSLRAMDRLLRLTYRPSIGTASFRYRS